MSGPEPRLDRALRSLGELPAPPPSAALEALVSGAAPVTPRRPRWVLGVVLVASLVVVALFVRGLGVRRDLAALPAWWFFTMTAAWFAAFLLPLAIALVPRRGSMLVETRVARIAALAIPAAAIAMAVLLRIDALPATMIPATPAETLDRLGRCLAAGIEVSALPFALGVLVLRRAPLPLRTRWVGAALGAANGTLAGLMLHVHCGIGGALHTGVAHAGLAVIGGIVGALLAPALTAGPRGDPAGPRPV
jgi:hypothetical protein